MSVKNHGPDHSETLATLFMLGATTLENKNSREAIQLATELVKLRKNKVPQDTPQLVRAQSLLAWALFEGEQFEAAEQAARECLSLRTSDDPDWVVAINHMLIGATLLSQKKYAEAETELLSGHKGMLEAGDALPPHSQDRVTECIDYLIRLYTETDNPEALSRFQALHKQRAEAP